MDLPPEKESHAGRCRAGHSRKFEFRISKLETNSNLEKRNEIGRESGMARWRGPIESFPEADALNN